MARLKAADVLKIIIASLLIFILFISAYVISFSSKTKSVRLLDKPAESYNWGWYYIGSDGVRVYIPALPAKIPAEPDGRVRIYHKYVSYDRKTLCFFTHHQNAWLYLNDVELYSFVQKGNPPWLTSYRSLNHMVQLPSVRTSLICLELQGLVNSRKGELNEIYIGERASVLHRLVLNRMDKLIVGLIVLTLGFLVLILSFTTLTKVAGRDFTMFYIALSFLSIGVWQLEESRVLQFFIASQPVHWCLEYMLQFVILYSALLIIHSLTPKRLAHTTNVFTAIILYISTMQLVMQITGMMQITASAVMLYIVFISICVYSSILVLMTIKFPNPLLKFLFGGSMFLGVFTFLMLMLFGNFASKSSNDFGLSRALIFTVFSLAVIVYQKTVERFAKLKEAQLYEKLALVDFNTGVSSKTAWFYLVEQFDYSQHVNTVYSLIMFDMNNLKVLNDTYGHLVGDKVINAFCDCMKDVFGGKGTIYRIGGDEFICLLENTDDEEVKHLLRKFDRYVELQSDTEYVFTVAYGWTTFKPRNRADFVEAQQRADALMYEMKKDMKTKMGENASRNLYR